MRRKISFNKDWQFLRQDGGVARTLAEGSAVTLPHTWNAEDGQDGGNDYYRGTCWYARRFPTPALTDGEEAWLEFEGAAMTACVYVNGRQLTRHEGGYSTFRVNITDALIEAPADDGAAVIGTAQSGVPSGSGGNILAVSVDNSQNRTVYPQKADFTFYGGIYRDVHLLIVPAAHFALGDQGSSGIRVTPQLSDDLRSAAVSVEAWVEGTAESVRFSIAGQAAGGTGVAGEAGSAAEMGSCEEAPTSTDMIAVEAAVVDGHALAVLNVSDVRLWNGVADPFLYTARAELANGDAVETAFGCRTIAFDAVDGFQLNGRTLRLCGAARHQDRQGIGCALTRAEHDEDMALIREMGANTVRLAHYQHSQYFYDLCDRHGLIVWAEIPYITEHMPEGRANTLSQMTELIMQNWNHPSIVCWGLSNEITAAGGVNADMVENHRLLNDLCHRLDPTRPTTMAHAFMLDPAEPFARLPDICGYNLYYGWYLAEKEQNDAWFDRFHAEHPDRIIGLSEYGADANPSYQASRPEKGDWSESYQAVYHEHMLEMWRQRPYIWAMHVWNMFDFGADGRDEGGKPGQNQKGLVTFDRKTKKDAFYIYKAYLSGEPFVHLCGRRQVDRCGTETEVKVYANLPAVTLFVDGKQFATLTGDKVFRFTVPIAGEHTIEARSGDRFDSMHIRRVEQPNPTYVMAGGEVVNWFDKPEALLREGHFSILDTMADLKRNAAAAAVLAEVMATARKSYGDVAKNVTMPESVQRLMDAMPLEKVLKQASKVFGPAAVKQLNCALNQIRKDQPGIQD